VKREPGNARRLEELAGTLDKAGPAKEGAGPEVAFAAPGAPQQRPPLGAKLRQHVAGA
jgi:hypothetical protein